MWFPLGCVLRGDQIVEETKPELRAQYSMSRHHDQWLERWLNLPGLSHSSPYVAAPQLDLVCSMRSPSNSQWLDPGVGHHIVPSGAELSGLLALPVLPWVRIRLGICLNRYSEGFFIHRK